MDYNFFSDSTLDRTSQWVAASRESLNHLTGPALPPKPSIIPTHEDYPGIPYGYENVLPISQRYQQNPYAMSMTGTEGTRYVP